MQERRNSIANALELGRSCTNPSMYGYWVIVTMMVIITQYPCFVACFSAVDINGLTIVAVLLLSYYFPDFVFHLCAAGAIRWSYTGGHKIAFCPISRRRLTPLVTVLDIYGTSTW